MNILLRPLPALTLASLLWAGNALAGPSFNVDEPPLAPANGGEASGPSFNSEAPSPAVSNVPAEQAPPAEVQPPQDFAESKEECRWLTSSIQPLRVREISTESGKPDYLELEFRTRFTNRSEDRVFTALKDVLLVLACTVETPSGKATVEMRYATPVRTLKKQRGPGDKVVVVHKLRADESCVVSKDEGVTWDDIASRLPSDWWGYAITHQYSVISQKY